jgi:hypothetical protein
MVDGRFLLCSLEDIILVPVLFDSNDFSTARKEGTVGSLGSTFTVGVDCSGETEVS